MYILQLSLQEIFGVERLQRGAERPQKGEGLALDLADALVRYSKHLRDPRPAAAPPLRPKRCVFATRYVRGAFQALCDDRVSDS